MKMVKSLLLGSAAGVVAVAGAQAADLPVKAKPVEYVKICSLYGDGFYYIPGTETCVRIGASAQADYYYGSLSNGHILFDGAGGAHDRTVSEHAMKGHGQIGLDGRTQTAYGTLRSVVILRMDNVDGGTVTPNVTRSYIQWAGFTFGHTKSYSDPFGSFGGGGDFRNITQGITHDDTAPTAPTRSPIPGNWATAWCSSSVPTSARTTRLPTCRPAAWSRSALLRPPRVRA